MLNTLRISFSLRNTYRVNGILYGLKQIPLLKRILPDALYRVRGFKVFANVLSVLWEIISIFLGKFLYILIMLMWLGGLYERTPADQTFAHILLFLTLIGSYLNTSLFDPTRDKYYAMILLRMDARRYTLANYGYTILKVLLGFLPFSLWFGLQRGLPLWFCLLFPLCVVGVKLTVAAYSLRDYEKNGNVRNENKLQKHAWIITGLLLALAYGLPAAGFVLPLPVSALLLLMWIPIGALSIPRVVTFRYYREINKELLAQMLNQMDTVKKSMGEKIISTDTSITSKRRGFEYLNELFIKRHQKILWKSTKKITAVCIFGICGMLLALYLAPEIKPELNELILNWLPYWVFIMYMLNRGTGFTRALFMNCDHSLLTYSFYKQPKFVLRLFQIRLREIMKINAVPALVLGTGLALLLFASGGTDNLLNYGVLVVSILCMSLFFSIHYLTIYYLLQPYNAGTEIKSGTFRIVSIVTYLVCYGMIHLKMPILVFGAACIAFCVVYSAAACVLVYKFAPRTFRIRT